MKNQNKFWYGLVIGLLLLNGCFKERKETPTKGHVTVLVGESVAPMMQQEEEKFEELYKQASIDINVMPSREALVKFFNEETTKVVVVSRPLNEEELAMAKQYQMKFQSFKIAFDAVAIIVNKSNPISKMRTTELDSVFRGIISSWKTVGWSTSSSSIAFCLPNQNSSTFEIMTTKILHGQKFAAAANVANTSKEMIDYVAAHPNSLGMVGLAWLNIYRDTVKVLELSDPYAPDSLGIRGQYFAPFQAHVYRGYYSLRRDVYIYSRTDNYSVAAGFITFIANVEGQKIIMKNGLVPATMPVRLVEVTSKELTQ
jgi:phosphate transport system substrate-binding protein